MAHVYTSTACYHNLHERCRKNCKFCETPCACACHAAQPAAEHPEDSWIKQKAVEEDGAFIGVAQPAAEREPAERELVEAMQQAYNWVLDQQEMAERIAAQDAELREAKQECERLKNEIAFSKDHEAAKLPRLIAAAIIIRDGKVLLEKRAPSGIEGLDNHWDLPGGKVEAGETVDFTAVREIKEELDIDVKPVFICSRPLPSTWIYPNRGPRHWCIVGVACTITNGEPKLTDSLQWFDLEDLPNMLLDSDRDLINQYQSHRTDNADLRAKLERSQWQQITPENMPKVGDELLVSPDCDGLASVEAYIEGYSFDDLMRLECRFVRFINAPKATP